MNLELSESGRIYVGVCVDTACTLGICAERNAIFHMLTNGEHEIKRVLAMPDGVGRMVTCQGEFRFARVNSE